MLGPDFETPSAPLAEDWRPLADMDVNTTSRDIAQWWTVLDDDVLSNLVERAAAQNLSLRVASLRIFEARAQLAIAVGNQYPQLQRLRGGLAQRRLAASDPNFNPIVGSSLRDVSVGFDAAWEIDVWGRLRRGVEAADATLMAEVAGYDDALVSLVAEVANSYVSMRTFEARLAIAHENMNIQKRSLKIATVRFENGVTSGLDVEQARTLLANTAASIPSLEIGLRQARNALSILLGSVPGELASLASGNGMIPVAPASVALGMPAELLLRRPDVRRAERRAAAQCALIGVALADLYPQFSLTANLGLQANDVLSNDLADLFDSDNFAAGVGPSFRWNILNYGRIKNAARVADARFQQAIVAYQDSLLQAAREVENALYSFVRGKQRVAILKESVAAARRSVELALVQYRDGAVDYTRVLDTQAFLLGQQDSYTAAQGKVVRDLISTYKALGGGWQASTSRELLPATLKHEMGTRTDWGELLELEPSDLQTDQRRRPAW